MGRKQRVRYELDSGEIRNLSSDKEIPQCCCSRSS